jgi:uncharacterized protein YdeI (YjbR/CyaY-like superfamily)
VNERLQWNVKPQFPGLRDNIPILPERRMSRLESVDEYIDTAEKWQTELSRLREILSDTALVEEIKWWGPCYTYGGKNVVGMAGFKSYFGLWFFQGALLDDDQKVLVNAQEGKTRAMRQTDRRSARA